MEQPHIVQQDPNIGLLMTYEEYEKTEQVFPYHFEIGKNGQRISYFGAEHIYDPNHEQTAKIKNAWDNFVTKTEKGQSIVLIECGTRDDEEEEIAIKHSGEAGLATFLAKEADIPVESPEPPLDYEVAELLKQFTKEEILYYYFARAVDQWGKTDKKRDMLPYVRNIVSDEAEVLGINKDILVILSDTHKKIFGAELDLNNLKHFEEACDPTNIYSVSNQVARATSILRDQYIVKEIEEKWKEGKSLFIVYGATHAIMQEPAIRSFVKE